MRRVLTFIVIGIVAIICISIATVYLSIGSVIVTAFEKYGSAIAGAPVTLETADFSPTSGETALKGLAVDTPPGFKATHVFLAPKIDLLIDPQTLGTDVIAIKRLEITAPEVTFEIVEGTDSLRTLRAHIDAAIADEKAGRFITGENGRTPKFIIHDLYINKGVVIVEAEKLNGRRTTAVLDDIHLQDVGRDENGLAPAALVRRIYSPLLQAVSLAILETDLPLSDQILNLLRSASEETDEMLERLRKLLEK